MGILLSQKKLGVAGLLLAAAAAGGCNQTSREARNAFIEYQVGNYGVAEQLLKPEITKKDEHFVLNNCRYGSCALAAGNVDGAENSFMAAYEVMNGVKTNDGGRTMGAALVFEGVKVWKGEPFEQAMAHYYLGLVFLLKDDYENARAAFQNSLFKVREYANKDNVEQYRQAESTFALGYFGLGFCYMRMGNSQSAGANFALAEKYNPALKQLISEVQNPNVNALIFIDGGFGPRKAGKGWYNEESAFGPTPAEVGPVPPAVAFVDGKPINNPQVPYNLVDTLAMAQERKWQDIDTLRKVKAAVGTGMMAAGTGVAAYGADRNDSGTALAGLGLIAAGALVAASSQSDVRYWEMLPRAVYIIPATLPPGEHQVAVNVAGVQSGVLTTVVKPRNPAVPADNVYYFRMR